MQTKRIFVFLAMMILLLFSVSFLYIHEEDRHQPMGAVHPIHPLYISDHFNFSHLNETENGCSQYAVRYDLYASLGFGSEINSMFDAAIYAKLMGRTFYVSSDVWNYGRWTDFFEPMTDCVYNQTEYHHISGFLDEDMAYPGNLYMTRDPVIQFQLQNQVIGEMISRFRIDHFDLKGRIAKRYWRLNDDMKTFVEKFIERVLPSEEEREGHVLVGMHVRRGDKVIEAELRTAEEYMQKAKELAGDQPVLYFVASDDLGTVVSDIIRSDHTSKVYYDHSAVNRKGHIQDEFNDLSLEQRRLETKKLISSLESLLLCDYIICTYSSNICRLLAILSSRDNIHSIDVEWYPFK